MAEKTYAVLAFKGLNDYTVPLQDASYTRSLNSVVTRYDRLLGGLGINKLRSISTVSDTTPIIGLMPFYDTALTTVLYRMTPTAVHKLNTGSDTWDDKTGTALTGTSTSIPQHIVHKDTLVFTNDGHDRPRQLLGADANSAVLGGTPPFCHGIFQAWGFLFLLNISDDGSTFYPRRLRYSDDFNVNWDLCNGNELNFNETNGGLVTGINWSEFVVIFKRDALFRLEFPGAPVRFNQPRIESDHGLLADLSAKKVEGVGAVYLGTDYRLHICNGYMTKNMPSHVQRKLDETLYKGAAKWAFATVTGSKDTYNLFYRSSASDSYARNRIMFNFTTGEFDHRVYSGHQFVSGGKFRYDSTEDERHVAASSTLVYELDTAVEDDDGTAMDRYYDIDWTDCGEQGEKYLKGVTLEAKANTSGRVAISVAANYSSTFIFEKFFSLRSLVSHNDYVKIPYRIDPGLKGTRFSVRIRIMQDDGTQVEIMPPALLHFEPESSSLNSQPSSYTSSATRVE